jgi:predicted AlkP superfamily phosphohydrolase/phosphomutase
MSVASKVIVIGLDGLEPSIVEGMMQTGELRNLARLRDQGGYSRIATTTPAQTPVAWSTFATGVNPGGHGIFDFLRRDLKTYLPELGLNRYEQKSAFLPPDVVNLRRGTPVWEVLTAEGIPSTVIRCPCSYPPDTIKGRMLSGMGVPDIRGGLGTATFYTTDAGCIPRESEQVVQLTGSGGRFRTTIIGPRNPRQRSDVTCEITFDVEADEGTGRIRSDGSPNVLELRVGAWSDWLRVRFRTGLLSTTAGMVRFLLVRTSPHVELYASPVNFDPVSPAYPISHPREYASELSRTLGSFFTTGMVEDHTGLSNGRFGEEAFIAQCGIALREREEMLMYELDRVSEGLVFCLFDTPDRVQHMFWRFRESDHPANSPGAATDPDAGTSPARDDFARVIEDHYAECDAIVGRALAAVDDRTLCVVLSDHGFTSFQRGVHLNSWLCENGFLVLKKGVAPGEDAGEFFTQVDWGRSSAYALGLGSVYLNVEGREAEGIVPARDIDQVSGAIARGLTGLVDQERGEVAIRGARTRRELYSGACVDESPDLVVEFNAGYRVSWTTALGGIPDGLVEDNTRKWGGDHIVDPALVPGILFMNRPFHGDGARLLDMAPTMLSALGVATPTSMEGVSLIGG